MIICNGDLQTCLVRLQMMVGPTDDGGCYQQASRRKLFGGAKSDLV